MALKRQYRATPDGDTYNGSPSYNIQVSIFGIFWKTLMNNEYFKKPLRYASRSVAEAKIKQIIKDNDDERMRKYIG